MGFFENAYDFDIFGGKFYDIGGNQINLTDDKSMRIGGGGNRTQILPNLSHQDSRTYNQREEQFIDDHAQAPTISRVSPQAHPEGQLVIDPQLYYEFRRWQEWQEWQEWQKWKEWQLLQQQQQSSRQGLPDVQPLKSADSQQQPSQTLTTAISLSDTAQNTTAETEQHPAVKEDDAIQESDCCLRHHHIDE